MHYCFGCLISNLNPVLLHCIYCIYLFLTFCSAVPPGEPVIMDEHGQRLREIIGPYDEGAFLTLACEVDGGKKSKKLLN